MPQLTDIAGKRTTKKFVKRDYRPWDLTGSGTTTSNNVAEPSSHVPLNHPEPKVQIINETSTKDPLLAHPELDNKKADELDNKKTTIKKHLDNNEITQEQQLANTQATHRKQNANILADELDNATSIETAIESIRNLTGIQEKMFFYLVEICTTRNQADTGHVRTSDLATIANCSVRSAKTSLERLVHKKLLFRNKGKTAKGGYLSLHISREIQAAATKAKRVERNLLSYKNLDNPTTLDNNKANDLSNSYASSSNINNKTTTTALPNEWLEIDLGALTTIGFSQSQLLQLYTRQLNTPEVIQESINHFAFGLENNSKVKNYPDPLNVLMGVLRKGLSWVEKDYISPKEKALTALYQLKKAEAERIAQLEKNIIDEEYKIWLQQLSAEQKNKILGNKPQSNLLSKELLEKANEGHLLNYFKENIYKK